MNHDEMAVTGSSNNLVRPGRPRDWREFDPIRERLLAEHIVFRLGWTSFGPLLYIDMEDAGWIAMTQSDRQPGCWYIGLVRGGNEGGTALADQGGGDWPPDEAVGVLREHLSMVAPHMIRTPQQREAAQTDYEQRCKDAATAQGLDPISARLILESIDHSVAQTGGFTMALHIPVGEQAYLLITDAESHGRWLVGAYLHEDTEGLEVRQTSLADWSTSGSDWGLEPDEAVAAIRSQLGDPSGAERTLLRRLDLEQAGDVEPEGLSL